MEQQPSATPTPEQRSVTWQVVELDRLPGIVEDTLEQRVIHDLAQTRAAVELLGSDLPRHQNQRGNLLSELTENFKAFEANLAAIRRVLRNPNQPLPLEIGKHREGHTTIALDLVPMLEESQPEKG